LVQNVNLCFEQKEGLSSRPPSLLTGQQPTGAARAHVLGVVIAYKYEFQLAPLWYDVIGIGRNERSGDCHGGQAQQEPLANRNVLCLF
jgi:hypothetical protein